MPSAWWGRTGGLFGLKSRFLDKHVGHKVSWDGFRHKFVERTKVHGRFSVEDLLGRDRPLPAFPWCFPWCPPSVSVRFSGQRASLEVLTLRGSMLPQQTGRGAFSFFLCVDPWTRCIRCNGVFSGGDTLPRWGGGGGKGRKPMDPIDVSVGSVGF